MHQITQDSPVQTRAGACNGESFRREIHTMGEEVCLEQGKLQQTQTDSVDKMLTGFDCHAGITRVERGLRFNQGVAGLNGSTGLGCDQNLQVLLATKPETQTVCSRAARLPMSMPARWCSAQCGSRQGPLGSVPQNVSRALKERSFTPSFGPCCLGKRFSAIPGPRPVWRRLFQGSRLLSAATWSFHVRSLRHELWAQRRAANAKKEQCRDVACRKTLHGMRTRTTIKSPKLTSCFQRPHVKDPLSEPRVARPAMESVAKSEAKWPSCGRSHCVSPASSVCRRLQKPVWP